MHETAGCGDLLHQAAPTIVQVLLDPDHMSITRPAVTSIYP